MSFDKVLDGITFRKVGNGESSSGLPVVTHEGELQIGSLTLKVYQLSNGQRIIPEEDFKKFVEFMGI
jgi:hypothetical protein